ncbi:MAG: PAS domain S-box protein [Lautropia sp.]
MSTQPDDPARSSRRDEARLSRFIERVSDYAIYMLTPEGRVDSWNAGAHRFKGYQESEILGEHFSRFFTPEDRAAGEPARILETAAREGRFEGEGWRVRKDGTRYWASVVVDPVLDDAGRLIGFAKITRDITERREAQEKLAKAQEALFQSQKLEAIGKLTGGVAHDFNNLLAVFSGTAELLARKLRSTPEAKLIDALQRATVRGAALTRQLLSFARQQPLQAERHDLNSVIGEFEPVLRGAISEGISLTLAFERRLRAVVIDAQQFEAALLNLLSNARDAMPKGGRATIETQNVRLTENQLPPLSAGDYVRVAVIDSGAGMPAEVAAKAIEPFFTTKPPGKGTGLGLSQAYGLAVQSGGILVIESEPGRGTTVSMVFPVAASAAEGDASDGGAAAERVLVVDDNADVLEVTGEMFREMGFEVLRASSAGEALGILAGSPGIQVLFSDVVMPGMDGAELGRRARQLDPSISVILASGFTYTEEREFPVLPKPFSTADIVRVLRLAPRR